MGQSLKSDIIAGFSVFLLALPLCLGIALASNFPPAAGILTAVVGGILTSLFSGAPLSIKGPAAGLIVVVLGAVQELGAGNLQLGYESTLAVGVVAAALQMIIATLKKGAIAEVISPSVIHGMLAAIGVIIVAKQIYVMMGITPLSSEPLMLLFHLPKAISHLNPVIFCLSLFALIIAVTWPLLKRVNAIPSSIIILLSIIPLSLFLNLQSAHSYTFLNKTYSLNPSFLVNLPANLFDAIRFPDFSQITSLTSIKYIIIFTLIGSIESLLTVCAIDSIAPRGAPSDLNKDLLAVGIGNLISSLIGGLPMISEIVRSKANIDYGAVSAKANFFHGLFMLIAVLLLPKVINLIPLSVLAALLVLVGIKLASPKEFIHTYKLGLDQFALFMTTFLLTLSVDLLVGVSLGILLKIVMHLIKTANLRALFAPRIETEHIGDNAYIKIEGPLTFLSYLTLKSAMQNAAKETSHIIISLQAVTFIDYTVSTKFKTLKNVFPQINITIEENPQLLSSYKYATLSRKQQTA